ncbi:hypothetical protein EV426DRAFT_619500 [Tirmania nivea]|nr:hypothetical protein EV426DRAFT_619500 [Tirmania nivea]
MLHKTTFAGVMALLAATFVQVSAATSTATVTVSECPLGTCTKICATPTVTVDPVGTCAFDILSCPMARCQFIPPITSTSTSYCKGACTSLITKGCTKLPTATVVPPCPTKCPELCPIPVETVAVACPTTVKVA